MVIVIFFVTSEECVATIHRRRHLCPECFIGSCHSPNFAHRRTNLAIMLDAGVGGPRDPQRAAQLRAQVKTSPDKNLVKKGTSDPGNLATTAAWQSGHYADAIQASQQAAAKGDANAEALLGKAYYEGVGVTRNYVTALVWLNKSVAQGNADAMFI